MRKPLVLVAALCVASATPAVAGWDEGVAAFNLKNYAQAVTEFQAVVQQNPDGYRGHYMLGESLGRLDRKEEALHHLRKAYDLNPNDVNIKLALGRAYSNLRRYNETAQLLKGLDVGSFPAAQRAAFHQIRGFARMKTDDVNGAVADYDQLAKLRPDDAETQYLYGVTILNAGRTSEGIAALAKAVRLDPKDADKKRTYANALVRQGRETSDKAAKKQIYLKAAAEAKDLAAANPSYDNLLLKASAELGAGAYADAVKSLQAAIPKNSQDWLGSYYLGQAFTSNGQFVEAQVPLNEALKKTQDPSNLKLIWKQLGFTFEKQKKYSDAIAAYQKAGDSSGVARVQENERTDLENKKIEEDNKRIQEMEAEAKKLEEDLKKISGGGGGR
ncbi:MAG: tetratricopeptide repeat protein [Thermoanaerobaculia bacterium]|nr:tetratricopeptide repeat protein [Thermoanaerobaculia bacterium]